MTTPNRDLRFTAEEMQRLERARLLVSAGDFHLTQSEFIHHATMQAVDEVLGVSRELVSGRTLSR